MSLGFYFIMGSFRKETPPVQFGTPRLMQRVPCSSSHPVGMLLQGSIKTSGEGEQGSRSCRQFSVLPLMHKGSDPGEEALVFGEGCGEQRWGWKRCKHPVPEPQHRRPAQIPCTARSQTPQKRLPSFTKEALVL